MAPVDSNLDSGFVQKHVVLRAAGTPKPLGARASEGASFFLAVHLFSFAWTTSIVAD